MARSSRHKSHRSHKHRDRSESEEEGNSRERKQRAEEGEDSARVSRVSDQEKRKSSLKDGVGTSNGDFSGENGKKRKDRLEEASVGGDRWSGGGYDEVRVDKEPKKDGSDALGGEKGLKSKVSVVDLKGKSSGSRKREASSDRNEEKRRSEKESSRRESNSSQYKDGKEKEREREREREKERDREREKEKEREREREKEKEREREREKERVREKEKERERERGLEKEKKVQDSRRERADDGLGRRGDRRVKQDIEIFEPQDKPHNAELDKELEKHKRRDGSGDRDKCVDGRDNDDRKISKDDHSKSGSYKEGRYKEKYREELERDERHREDKRRDDSRAHTTERSENKYYRDDSRDLENRYKKSKLHDSDRVDDEGTTKLKDNRERKRSIDDIDEHNDVKPRSAKDLREDTAKTGSSSSKFDSRSDRARPEHLHLDKVDSSMSSSRLKSSPSSSVYAVKDQSRHSSKQEEPMHRDSLSEDTRRPVTISRDHATSFGARERMSESRSSEKGRLKDDSRTDAILPEGGGAPRRERISRPDSHTSPNQLTERSPSSTSDRRSERIITPRRNLDMDEVGQRPSILKGGREQREYLGGDKRNMDENYKNDPPSNRTPQLQGNSPAHLPPPPPVRIGVDSPSVLNYEHDARSQSGDRKLSSRYRSGGSDSSISRGPGTPWKGPPPTWPSPAGNGFMPLQHVPSTGFHPGIQQFSGPPIFGVRPPMDLNHTASYHHINEAANRFVGHARPYGWHNPVDDCPSHLQVWDESQIYNNRHLMSSRGWEMSADMWGGQTGNSNMESMPDEAWAGHHSRDERSRSEQPVGQASGAKVPNDATVEKHTAGTSKPEFEKTVLEPLKAPSVKESTDCGAELCRHYLSKLDISPDLAHPDIYKQCMALIGSGDKRQQKDDKDGFRFVLRNKQYDRRVLPKANASVFERSMALYKKQREESKLTGLPPLSAKKKNNPPPSAPAAPAAAAAMGNVNANASNHAKNDSNAPSAAANDYMEEEENDSIESELCKQACELEEERGRCEKPGEKVSDAVVSVEGTEKNEPLNAECKVNVSRIHL